MSTIQEQIDEQSAKITIIGNINAMAIMGGGKEKSFEDLNKLSLSELRQIQQIALGDMTLR